MVLSSPRVSGFQATLEVPLYDSEEEKHRYLLAQAVRNILDGKINSIGSFTLTVSASTTIVKDHRAGTNSVIIPMPTTENAGGEVGMYFTNIGEESGGVRSFTVNHATDSRSDRTFRYALLG